MVTILDTIKYRYLLVIVPYMYTVQVALQYLITHKMAEISNQTTFNNSLELDNGRFDGTEDQTNSTAITIIFIGILVVFIIVVLLVIHRVIKIKEARNIKNRNKSKQFIGSIYKKKSLSLSVSTFNSSPPITSENSVSPPVMSFDNPTFDSSPKKQKKMESTDDCSFECEVIDMDEIDPNNVIQEDVDIVMVDTNGKVD